MSWLTDCGLIHKINRATKPAVPLKAYEDFTAFKLFLVDVGLLSAMGDLDVKTLLEGSAIFEEFKGALTEQYVLQQLVTPQKAIRTSMSDFRKEEWMTNLPLYAVSELIKVVS